jgi:HD superfamily phosphohydrolase YqeK
MQIVGFAGLVLLSESAPIPTKRVTASLSFIVVVAAIVSIGPVAAAIAVSCAGVDWWTVRRRRWSRVLFNGAQYALATAAAGLVYERAGGPVGELTGAHFPRVFLPLVCGSVVFLIVNSSLVSILVSRASRVPFLEVLTDGNILGPVANLLAFAVLGVMFAALYLQMGFAAVLFVLVPMAVARRAMQAAAEMDSAYESTLRGLVTAIEAKDAYTRGHAERVSELAAMIAREVGLNEVRVRMLRYAALMHDVGKLVVSTTVLTKPGKLTPEEYEHMKAHPMHGVAVIEEIDFLRDGEAVNAVRHHHERLDGLGYPDNLSGDDVPLTARIVMVADAFDSMTSTRSYRPAMPVARALTELRRCAATQFDPQMISALDRAIVKRGWEPSPEAFHGEQVARPAVAIH